jgi:hypothetical protein
MATATAKKSTAISAVHQYRINSGAHVTEDGKRHPKGSTFWSAADLLRHNLPGERRIELLSTRERVSAGDYAELMANGSTTVKLASAPAESEDKYPEWNLDELVAYAGEEGIDLTACNGDKAAIVEVIQAADSSNA